MDISGVWNAPTHGPISGVWSKDLTSRIWGLEVCVLVWYWSYQNWATESFQDMITSTVKVVCDVIQYRFVYMYAISLTFGTDVWSEGDFHFLPQLLIKHKSSISSEATWFIVVLWHYKVTYSYKVILNHISKNAVLRTIIFHITEWSNSDIK